MIKYFFIENSLNEQIMGKIPQIKEFVHHCHVEEESKFIDKFVFERIDIIPILSNLVLYEEANLTDFIDSYGHVGFNFSYIITNKFKTLLDEFNCYGFQFFETYIIHKNQKLDNYWQIKKYNFPYQFIDFKKTSFVLKDRDINRKIISKTISFDNFDEFNSFLNTIKYPKMIFFEKIYFTESMHLDFFDLRYTANGHKGIVSDKLKREIENQKISGIEFRPIELSYDEWFHGGEREKIYGKV